jgi:hypothetical protein
MVTGMRRHPRIAAAALVMATGVFGFWAALQLVSAQPVRDRVLSRVQISEDAECAVVKIWLNFPVRYISHFPFETGDELRIKLQAIEIGRGDSAGLRRRESLRAPKSALAAIAEIVYEGDDLTGPTLTLFFEHPVAFKVAQGADSRSFLIAISGKSPSDYCDPVDRSF